jgi:hypothetical protein
LLMEIRDPGWSCVIKVAVADKQVLFEPRDIARFFSLERIGRHDAPYL